MTRSLPASRFTWKHAVIAAAVVAALVCVCIAIAPVVTRPRITALVHGAGPWGPLILIAVQIAQILIAPIPGVFLPILAGALYGPLVGSLIAVVGTLLGSLAAYTIGSRVGVPLMTRWIGAEKVAKVSAIVGGRRWLGLVLIFLFPFTPADAICFVAGMVGMKAGPFFLAILLGRVPKECALALAGAGLIRLGGLFARPG
jgi:uncharacterized membrane protein YdjX (TVP38/TMEM64 family)